MSSSFNDLELVESEQCEMAVEMLLTGETIAAVSLDRSEDEAPATCIVVYTTSGRELLIGADPHTGGLVISELMIRH